MTVPSVLELPTQQMNEQRFASGQSHGSIIILARSLSQSRREHGSFCPFHCERRLERQRCTFSVDLYATLYTACAVDASVRSRAAGPRPLLVARRASHVGGPSRTRPGPLLLMAPLPLFLLAAPAVARPSETYRAYRERRCQKG
jgi:hypothetical protein